MIKRVEFHGYVYEVNFGDDMFQAPIVRVRKSNGRNVYFQTIKPHSNNWKSIVMKAAKEFQCPQSS